VVAAQQGNEPRVGQQRRPPSAFRDRHDGVVACVQHQGGDVHPAGERRHVDLASGTPDPRRGLR
jgi:hypothetical protein